MFTVYSSLAMSELELLSLLVFLYQNRSRASEETSAELEQASDMLLKSGHIRLDVDTCQPVRVDGASTNSLDAVISLINEYQPVSPLALHAATEEDMKSISRMSTRAIGRYTYSKSFTGPMPFPRLHGGEVVCDGDVQLQTILDSVSISEYSALMTSFCVISGRVLGCTEPSLDQLCRGLRRRLQLSSDDDAFGFLLVGDSDHTLKYTRDDFVRSWRIACTASKGKLKVQVIHSLR